MEQSAEKKVIHVHSEVNLIADALLYYTRRANCRPMSASIKRMREQYPENRESIDSLFGPMEELEKALDAASSQVDEERSISFLMLWGMCLPGTGGLQRQFGHRHHDAKSLFP